MAEKKPTVTLTSLTSDLALRYTEAKQELADMGSRNNQQYRLVLLNQELATLADMLARISGSPDWAKHAQEHTRLALLQARMMGRSFSGTLPTTYSSTLERVRSGTAAATPEKAAGA